MMKGMSLKFPVTFSHYYLLIKRYVLILSRANIRFQAVERQLETLRREMRTLSARVHELEPPGPASASNSSAPPTTGSLHRILDAPRSPTYVGPTSAEFGLTRSQRSLSHQADDCAAIDDRAEGLDLSTTAPSPAPSGGENAPLGNPLISLGADETLRLVQVYEDTVGVMYPCIDLDEVRAYVLEFYRSHDSTVAALSVLSTQTASDQDWFSARDVQVLKILLATALLVESHGRSERAAQLADSVEDRFASRLKIAEVDMKEILILTLLVCISNRYSVPIVPPEGKRIDCGSPFFTLTATTKSSPGV